uniref:BKRF1 encodes EBNA-1 protein-like n=1 Tax=Oryza sativa subsp. japonica TaxID=39947 RepID=Q652Z0_ORYSJ|nr:BKRF1 encodes EBNA-1 protein-like [Oryza sativa Japonica Group]BAD54198.1 BKRF1 encodes EBNA-1 protein-like [Oryza sativa Japonica Group]
MDATTSATGNDKRTTTTAANAGGEARTTWNTLLRCRRRRRRREMTSRRGGTADRRRRRRGRTMTTTKTGGVREEGRRGRGRSCRCDAEGDGDDVGRRTDEEQKPARGWEVLPAGEDTTPESFGRGDGEAGEEDDAAELREATARPTDAQARQQRRLVAVQWRQRHWTSTRTHFQRSPRETEGRLGERRRLRRRGWRRHGLPAWGGSRPREERGTAAENSADGHGKRLGKARPFWTVESTNQEGNKEEGKGIKRPQSILESHA